MQTKPHACLGHTHDASVATRALVQATSDMLAGQQQLLPLLHQLEAVSSGSTIGPLAETLLEELQQSGSRGVGQAITQLRVATKAAMKAKAMARRKAMLASLNMPAPVSPTLPCCTPLPPPPYAYLASLSVVHLVLTQSLARQLDVLAAAAAADPKNRCQLGDQRDQHLGVWAHVSTGYSCNVLCFERQHHAVLCVLCCDVALRRHSH